MGPPNDIVVGNGKNTKAQGREHDVGRSATHFSNPDTHVQIVVTHSEGRNEMRKSAISAILALSILMVSTPSQAKLIFLQGTVISLFVSGAGSAAETVDFIMSFGAQTTGCTNPDATNQVFYFSPTDISDAQTRKNMLAVLIAARISGTPVTVDWDNAGANCDANGFPIPLFVGM
jgi:hypothetical protein